MLYVSIMVGGVAGGMLRAWVTALLPNINATVSGVLAINLLGCLALGLVRGVVGGSFVRRGVASSPAGGRAIKPWLQVGVTAGLIGSFTTFSTFCVDLVELSRSAPDDTLLYGLLGLIGGPLLCYAGNLVSSAAVQQISKRQEELSA